MSIERRIQRSGWRVRQAESRSSSKRPTLELRDLFVGCDSQSWEPRERSLFADVCEAVREAEKAAERPWRRTEGER